MKILGFVDIHLSNSAIKELKKKAREADILVCCGDVSIFEEGLRDVLRKLDSIGKEILIIHGNHETEEIMALECGKLENLVYVHKKLVSRNNVDFIGYGGGGFSEEDDELRKFAAGIKGKIKSGKLVFFTHAPPFGTKLDLLSSGHRGNRSITRAVNLLKPDLLICGHLHENFKTRDRLGKTRMVNPGPYGELLEV